MATIKTIAIIGATTHQGCAIAVNFFSPKLFCRLLLVSDDLAKLVSLKSQLVKSGTEAFAISCAREASWEADIIIVATPYTEYKFVAEKIREVATGKIVISVSYPINGSVQHAADLHISSAAEELQRLLPHSKVVKTFNATFAADFIRPAIRGTAADVFIAGNNSDAVETVFGMVKVLGHNPIIAGDLSVSRTFERMRIFLCNGHGKTITMS